jgi:hypothetical protein
MDAYLRTRTLDGGPSLPLCVSVTARPAIVIVAVRVVRPRFAAIESVAVPLPEPLPLDVTHAGSPAALHEHPACAVTVTEPLPAAAPKDSAPGDTA